jgi:hypothetical protein
VEEGAASGEKAAGVRRRRRASGGARSGTDDFVVLDESGAPPVREEGAAKAETCDEASAERERREAGVLAASPASTAKNTDATDPEDPVLITQAPVVDRAAGEEEGEDAAAHTLVGKSPVGHDPLLNEDELLVNCPAEGLSIPPAVGKGEENRPSAATPARASSDTKTTPAQASSDTKTTATAGDTERERRDNDKLLRSRFLG